MARQTSPYLKSPLHPNFLKRRIGHDYCRPARYLLTLMKASEIGILSEVNGSPYVRCPDANAPATKLTEDGAVVERALQIWQEKYPQLRVERYVIMPDHVHVCVFVHSYLKPGLSRAVSNLMGKATRLRHDSLPEEIRPKEMVSFFSKGYNDRIAFTNEQWMRQLDYVADNPRRYLIKKIFPEYYRNVWIVTSGERSFHAMGNIFLLKNPDMQAVRFSRRFSNEEYENYIVFWKRCVANMGVLVSPFIHPKEKEMRKYAVENGASIIRICEKGFEERFAPQGEEFELMAEGRLLLVALLEYKHEGNALSYGKAQEMNGLAAWIAGADWYGPEVRIRRAR